MNIEKRKVGNWPAVIHSPSDDTGWKYVITYDGENGAIISNVNLEEAERIFIEAMSLGNSVYKLMYFSEFGVFPINHE